MYQPQWYEVEGKEYKVYKLNKSLYGLKQFSRQWHHTFQNAIISYGFVPNNYDHCIYTWNSGSYYIILSLYVDDILLAGNDINRILELKDWLNTKFEMKDMGEAHYVLGIKISRDRKQRKLSLSQKSYLENILKKFKMDSCKPIESPIYKWAKLSKNIAPKTEEEIQEMKSKP